MVQVDATAELSGQGVVYGDAGVHVGPVEGQV